MSTRTTPPDRSPAETTTFLEIPPAPDDRDPSESDPSTVESERVGGESVGADVATPAAERTEAEPVAADAPRADTPHADIPHADIPHADTADVPAAETAPAATPDPGHSTAVLQPLDIPPAPATIPALPLAPRDPADRPFAHPQRSTPGKPESWWRLLFRRGR